MSRPSAVSSNRPRLSTCAHSGSLAASPREQHAVGAVTDHVAHAVREDGHDAGLADDDVSPLHDDDREEVRGLRLLEALPAGGSVQDVVRERVFVAAIPGAIAEGRDGGDVGSSRRIFSSPADIVVDPV